MFMLFLSSNTAYTYGVSRGKANNLHYGKQTDCDVWVLFFQEDV